MKTYLKVGGGLAKFLAEAVHALHTAFESHTRETEGLIRRADNTAFPPFGLFAENRCLYACAAGLCCVAHAS